jgi:hypothetical protein
MMVPRPGNISLYSNDMYTDKTLGFLKNSTDGKSFFAYLAFQVAHSSFQSPQVLLKKYDKIYQIGWDEIRKQSFENEKKLGFGLLI